MTRLAFDTGQRHQCDVAAWARWRIADGRGQTFDDDAQDEQPWQWGCVLADGVGLGKTWEALAATALILDKSATWGSGGARLERKRRRAARVLILTPPGLVTKWSRELRDPHGFPLRLREWIRRGARREFIAATFEDIFELRVRGDLDDLPRGTIRRGQHELPDGIYVCNWNVFLGPIRRGRDRVNALRKQEWDVLIVDEAHHRRAREALEALPHYVKLLLLSATPFQLDPTELHALTKHVMQGDRAHRLLERGAVRDFVRSVDGFFKGEGEPPAPQQRKAAERVLGQIVARSKVRGDGRAIFSIDESGKAHMIASPSALGEADLEQVFKRSIEPTSEFEQWYLGRRLALASREAAEGPAHIAVELRKLLSTKARAGSQSSARVDALRRWAAGALECDLRAASIDGVPRKLLVFTSFVELAADELRKTLAETFDAAYRRVRREPHWKAMRSRAGTAIDRVLAEVEAARGAAQIEGLPKTLSRLRQALVDSPFHDLFGHRGFAKRVKMNLLDRIEAVTPKEGTEQDDVSAWVRRQRRARRRASIATLQAIASAPMVATYTGDDDQREREANGEAFRSPLAPWILVASNVGSEGIDLHTYSRHLVHFELEWNPARMEQREGRIDRIGRALDGPVSIYYLIVRGTYDERMFHQLVARQRWHGVLLGRTGNQLVRHDGDEAPVIPAIEARKITLDLHPKRGRR